MIGQDRHRELVTVVYRASLYICSSQVFSQPVQVVSQAIIHMLRPFKERVQTQTFAASSEFVKHEVQAHALEAYLAHPHSSWERGINENINSLNNRPRKTRRYRTPSQLFHQQLVPLVEPSITLTP